jgi:hypothetical protein
MLRRTLFVAAISVSAAAVTPALAQSQTIRIEPRPYYGAVVTLEQGVRVWRPLPPTSHMIINPTNAPVSVNVTDVRETVNHTGPVYAAPSRNQAGGYANPGYRAAGLYAGRRTGQRHHARPVFGARPGRH